MIAPSLAGNILGTPNDSFVIAEWQDAGGPTEPPRFIAPRHLHHYDDEAWYVLEGILRLQSGENEIEAHAGSAVLRHTLSPRNPIITCALRTFSQLFLPTRVS